jgi:hypothetical protein
MTLKKLSSARGRALRKAAKRANMGMTKLGHALYPNDTGDEGKRAGFRLSNYASGSSLMPYQTAAALLPILNATLRKKLQLMDLLVALTTEEEAAGVDVNATGGEAPIPPANLTKAKKAADAVVHLGQQADATASKDEPGSTFRLVVLCKKLGVHNQTDLSYDATKRQVVASDGSPVQVGPDGITVTLTVKIPTAALLPMFLQ